MNDPYLTALVGVLGALIGLIVARLTVKTQLTISENDRIQQMRLAALEKRLAKHQEAYALFYELFWNMNERDKVGKAVMKCQSWWVENCLYLDARSRRSFKVGYHLALNVPNLMASERTPEMMKALKESHRDIMQVFEDLEKGVDLTPTGEEPDKEKLNANA